MANAKVEKVKEVKKVEKTKKYAVIRISGRQYLVEEGKDILVDKLKDLKNIEPEVLLIVDGDNVKVGKPIVAGSKVKIKVITEVEKGKKVRIFKYKAKSRYRKRMGFRPKYTRLLIEQIS